MLWIKAFHIIFVVTWFAGLFYLPRLFIYHAEAGDELSRSRFTTMERRLFAIMTIGAVLTLIVGLILLWLNPGLLRQGWFHLKLAFLVAMAVYHWLCLRWIGRLAAGYQAARTVNLRWFNEVPVVFLLGIIFLAVLKPSL